MLILISDLHDLWTLNGKHLSQQTWLQRQIDALHVAIVLPRHSVLIQDRAPWDAQIPALLLGHRDGRQQVGRLLEHSLEREVVLRLRSSLHGCSIGTRDGHLSPMRIKLYLTRRKRTAGKGLARDMPTPGGEFKFQIRPRHLPLSVMASTYRQLLLCILCASLQKNMKPASESSA